MSKKSDVITDAKITTSVSSLVSFIKSQAKNSLVEGSKDMNISRSDLIKLSEIIDNSITQSMINGMQSVVDSIKK
tara:strand:- start:149 stop:373 length:225 start_codon:yes stop_codon:yes gene_type:complete